MYSYVVCLIVVSRPFVPNVVVTRTCTSTRGEKNARPTRFRDDDDNVQVGFSRFGPDGGNGTDKKKKKI